MILGWFYVSYVAFMLVFVSLFAGHLLVKNG